LSATGTVAPGSSAGTLNIDGDYTQGTTGQLLIELASLASFDRLIVDEDLNLAGTLVVSLINGFAPAAGNTFDILDFNPATLSGTFNTISLPALGGGLLWNTSQLYTTGVLSVASAGILGDYNDNGTVDAADYILWRKGGPLANEVDNPGTVNGQDYTEWRARFGNPNPGGGVGSNANASIPEPTSVMLLLMGMAVMRVPRRAIKSPS
jgi:hypothetical protein